MSEEKKPKKGRKPKTVAKTITVINEVLNEVEVTPVKEPKVPTAKKISDSNKYSGEVSLFELSKQLKKGSIGTNYVLIARIKPRHGTKNTVVMLANENGDVVLNEPIREFRSDNMEEAISQLGYKLV